MPEMIASSAGMHFSKIFVENVLLLTTKQGLHKYNLNIRVVRRTRRHTFM